jgi:hypothetical protein
MVFKSSPVPCARVSSACGCAVLGDRARAEEGLLIEWPKREVEPTRYGFSTLPQDSNPQAVCRHPQDMLDNSTTIWSSKASLASVESNRSLEHFRNRPRIQVSDISRLKFRGQVLRQEFG